MISLEEAKKLEERSDELLYKSWAKAGHSKQTLSRCIGCRYQTVLSWFKGAKPNLESLIKLQAFLQLGGSDND